MSFFVPGPAGPRLDLRTAARRLGCSLRGLYALIDAGQVPAFTVGPARRPFVLERDLDAYRDRNPPAPE